ncbi:TPA: hypothetical protein U2D50_001398 [Streptococcus suis]|nr:hypothetical protein [Streptococcus suis]HEM6419310.1 hypothetical protein [Streptococcus suis]HEM6425509.1 hypothetical protein [Streptococcus suis]
MKIVIRSDEIKMTDESMTPLTSLYAAYSAECGTVDLCTYQPEKGEQHDISLSIKDWIFVKNFMDQKIKEATND